MFKRNEKTSTKPARKGVVFHGAISAQTKGGQMADEFDGEAQKRIELGLSAD